jgi:hypothetical protein
MVECIHGGNMKVQLIEMNGIKMASLNSSEILIQEEGSALDLFASIYYEYGTDRIAMEKSSINEQFFDLRTGLAGAVVQKLVNYRFKLAVYGDCSHYESRALRDFIYECNQGKDIIFTETLEEATEKLSKL